MRNNNDEKKNETKYKREMEIKNVGRNWRNKKYGEWNVNLCEVKT